MFKWAQRIARILIVLFTLGVMLFSIFLAWFVFGLHNAERLSQPEVAFWMEHRWSTSEHGDFVNLAHQIDGLSRTSLYFHVGPIEEDGTLANDLQISPANLASLPSTNFAWLGQIRSQIDLSNPAVRASIIASSEWLLSQGFDGIHLDIEPIRPDDVDFRLLLEEMDAAFPHTLISVAMDEWQPDLLTRWVAHWLDTSIVSYWTSEQVLSYQPFVDEFVVMTYDTGFKDPRLYSWWVEHQSVALSQLMDEDTRLLIGLPVYEEGSRFHPEAENLETGLIGYTKGLSNLRSNPDGLDGIAIYPYWEMDEEEWNILNAYFQDETDLFE